MAIKNTSTHYNKLSIILHWLMLLVLIAVYASIELRVLFDKGTETRDLFKMWHFMLGLSVLLLVTIRLFIRLKSGSKPLITPSPAKWQTMAASITHIALYAFMFAMPLAGWFMLSLFDAPIPFYGFELPALAAKNTDLVKQIKYLHETTGVLGYYLIALHASAALLHHYIIKDNTLKRILFKK